MIATPTTGPATAPAIHALLFEDLTAGVGEIVALGVEIVVEAVELEVVELDRVPSVLVVEVVAEGTARYMVQALHEPKQSTLSTDDP